MQRELFSGQIKKKKNEQKRKKKNNNNNQHDREQRKHEIDVPGTLLMLALTRKLGIFPMGSIYLCLVVKLRSRQNSNEYKAFLHDIRHEHTLLVRRVTVTADQIGTNKRSRGIRLLGMGGGDIDLPVDPVLNNSDERQQQRTNLEIISYFDLLSKMSRPETGHGALYAWYTIRMSSLILSTISSANMESSLFFFSSKV